MSWARLVHLGAGALLLAALLGLARSGIDEPRVAVAFAVVIALGELARVRLPGGRDQAPIGAAVTLAYALLGPLRGVPTGHGVLQVVAVAGLGTLLGSVRLPWWPKESPGGRTDRETGAAGEAGGPRHRRAAPAAGPGLGVGLGVAGKPAGAGGLRGLGLLRPTRRARPAGPGQAVGAGAGQVWVDTLARRLLGAAFAATLFQPLYNSGALDRAALGGPGYGVYLTVVAGLTALCDATLAAVLHRGRTGLRFTAALEDELRSLLGIGSAVVATGMLVSLLAGEIGLWALPLFCTPLLFVQASFRRAAAVRATTGQTIETLARATEIAGYTPVGHARRVADTARELGRELGLGTRELALLEYAALMHDIGQLSLVEPVPGGATASLALPAQQRIARLGSEVIRRTGVPRQVSRQVARLADPYRRPDGGPDRSLPLAARIIKVANAHDELLTAALGGGLGPAEAHRAALERLRADGAAGYDPRVLALLGRSGPAPAGQDPKVPVQDAKVGARSALKGRRGWMRS
ncbi:HD domain-containing phosphohydrolase [Kitasatospora sp. NPDC002227]|uniref:HD domain-containing phosphohydrolase n=1 Tax=Kitasatospora sp. NPDC002227 TaxID=3154773 RepID=UPI0033193F83